jgi:ATPase subunit of ABC transporter with duplicated ATPase domains
MISVTNVSLRYGAKKLFEDVNVKFTPGNCYGLIGANGAGKSTFLKILSGEIEPNTGAVIVPPGMRLSVLKQDHYAYDQYSVLKTVMMGNSKLIEIIEEKEKLYSKPDFSEQDGIRATELETLFSELNGWEAESEAGAMLADLGIKEHMHLKQMSEINTGEKVKVLLAQALFGQPDILLLDEPTNHLDIYAVKWLEDFLEKFANTLIVVSHDRHFLNKVCTHMADIDYSKVTTYTGNYDFWRQASELQQRLLSDLNKKNADKAEELKSFIRRFSANASKSRQASSRQKQLEKLDISEIPRSTRRSPFIEFEQKRELGQDILIVKDLSKTVDGKTLFSGVNFTMYKDDKIVLLGPNDLANTVLLDVLSGKTQPDKGSITWGQTAIRSYLPTDNSNFFQCPEKTLVEWLRSFSENKDESFVRGFLGKMLFSRDEGLKDPSVLSGGEKVRCMLAKMMLAGGNVLILDGPTNHLDLESISALNDAVTRFKGNVIFTSHDHEFIQTIANRILVLDESIRDDRRCTFDEYLAKL